MWTLTCQTHGGQNLSWDSVINFNDVLWHWPEVITNPVWVLSNDSVSLFFSVCVSAISFIPHRCCPKVNFKMSKFRECFEQRRGQGCPEDVYLWVHTTLKLLSFIQVRCGCTGRWVFAWRNVSKCHMSNCFVHLFPFCRVRNDLTKNVWLCIDHQFFERSTNVRITH